jgi:acid phosphatase family membrane protein YuiD
MIQSRMKYRVCVLAIICWVAGAGHVKAQGLDLKILQCINPSQPDAVFWQTTSSSAYWIPAAASLGTLGTGYLQKNKKLQQNGYELFMSIGISSLLSSGLKVTINRPRPAETHPETIYVNTYSTGRSFPSGHTTVAFATAATISLQYKKWYITVPAYVWAAAVGYSRMYLGRHYPTDVLGGAAVGIGSAYLSHWLSQKFFKQPAAKR